MAVLSHIDPLFYSALHASITHLENDNLMEKIGSKKFLYFEDGWGGIYLLVYC